MLPTPERGDEMYWGPLDGQRFARRADTPGQQWVAFTAGYADAEVGAPVHVYASACPGGAWLYFGESGWDGVTPLFDLRTHMVALASRGRTEGDA